MTTDQSATRSPTVRILFVVSGLLLWTLVGLFGYGTWKKSQAPTPSPDQAEISQPPAVWNPEGIDDFELIDQNGRKVTKADLLGRPWLVCFIFTHCTQTCPRISGQMARLQTRLKETDVRLVSITVDPANDTPEQLHGYAEIFGAEKDRWLFLTGDKEQIYKLLTDSFRVSVMEITDKKNKSGYTFTHSNSILHIDRTGRVVRKYDALSDTETALLRRTLIEKNIPDEAASPKQVSGQASPPESKEN